MGLLDRDHYDNNILDRLDDLENRLSELDRLALVLDSKVTLGDENVRIDKDGIVLVDSGASSVTKLKWKFEEFLGETIGDILSDWTGDVTEDAVTWIRAFEQTGMTTGEAQIILKVDNLATLQTDDTRLTMHSATHKIVFGGVDLFEIRDDVGDTLYFSADDTEGIIADGVQMKDGSIIASTAISARAYNSANINIANDTAVYLTFDSERWDTDAIHDLSTNTGRLTCVTAGHYLIVGQVTFDTDADGYRSVAIILNRTTGLANPIAGAAPAGTTRVEAVTVYELAVGDYVELQVKHTAGAALNVLALSAHSPEFMMVRLV